MWDQSRVRLRRCQIVCRDHLYRLRRYTPNFAEKYLGQKSDGLGAVITDVLADEPAMQYRFPAALCDDAFAR